MTFLGAVRARPVRGLLMLAVAVSIMGCDTRTGLSSLPTSSPTPSSPTPSSQAPSASAPIGTSTSPSSTVPSPSVPDSPVTGVVTKVDSAGLGSVSGFTLRTDAGQTLVLSIGTLENGAQFPPGHLAEHLATAAPVRIWFRVEGGKLVVYRIEDAA